MRVRGPTTEIWLKLTDEEQGHFEDAPIVMSDGEKDAAQYGNPRIHNAEDTLPSSSPEAS